MTDKNPGACPIECCECPGDGGIEFRDIIITDPDFKQVAEDEQGIALALVSLQEMQQGTGNIWSGFLQM